MSQHPEISVAPMMDRTDRHCRYFHRLLAPDVLLYTEMVVAQAAIHGDRERLLGFDAAEHPLALQFGGSDPDQLARATAIADEFGYDEYNLNIGCPSDRVQSGQFGACLMAEPERVADCVRAMQAETDRPVTVKTRIGIDDQDSYEFLKHFVSLVADAGCRKFIVHARKAILEGLSPKENRSIPPLRYDVVYRLKDEFPELKIILNGGVRSLTEARTHLEYVDGVMVGRQGYSEPYLLAELQTLLDESYQLPERQAVIRLMADYAGRSIGGRTRLHHISRHMLGLYAGQPGARAWRRFISEGAVGKSAGPEVLTDSISGRPPGAS